MNYFTILFNELKGRKVLLYGTGVWCHRLLEGLKDTVMVEGILDRDKTGGSIEGIPILQWNDIRPGTADAVIIASRPQFYKEIFTRIGENCSRLNLEIYSSDGRNMKDRETFVHDAGNGFTGGLFLWYDYVPGTSILIIAGSREEADAFEAKCTSLKGCRVEKLLIRDVLDADCREQYDCIVCLILLEKQRNIGPYLQKTAALLKAGGKFLFGMNNRFGLRYFCGDRDPYSSSVMDSIDGYRNVPKHMLEKMDGWCYSRAEMERMLSDSGFNRAKFYSVFPDLVMPSLIYADTFTTKEELNIRYHPKYNSPETLFLEEESLLTDLLENKLFHPMANAFLIECSRDGIPTDVNHVTLTLERDGVNALATIIRSNGTVEKKALYRDGSGKFSRLAGNTAYLKSRGIKVVEGDLVDGRYRMPFIDAPTGTAYFNSLFAAGDREKLIRKMDEFRQTVLSSSDWVSGSPDDDDGVILKKGFIDLVALNCFVINDEFHFYDQEFCFDRLPANVIIWRTLTMVYGFGSRKEDVLPMSFFLERYRLAAKFDEWGRLSALFTDTLRNEGPLRDFNLAHERRDARFLENRKLMNAPGYDFRTKQEDIFGPVGNRKLILFGAGKYAGRFMDEYGLDYEVAALADNDPEKWGSKVLSHPVIPPSSLKDYNPAEFYVIICTARYKEIEKQLTAASVRYGIYLPGRIYPKHPDFLGKRECGAGRKKYRTGYMPGVFDLYHVGHLNMFRRAKELCDYLIVGLESDEWVRLSKKRDPFVPFEERRSLLEACIYIDKVVAIPTHRAGTMDAHAMYNFDVIFSGSDHQNEQSWVEEKAQLEKLGATVHYFPYTESTSSTKLRQLIEMALI